VYVAACSAARTGWSLVVENIEVIVCEAALSCTDPEGLLIWCPAGLYPTAHDGVPCRIVPMFISVNGLLVRCPVGPLPTDHVSCKTVSRYPTLLMCPVGPRLSACGVQ